MNRAAVESLIRVIVSGVVGAGVVTFADAGQQELAITSIAAIVWIGVSLWWSKKSDQAIKKENA